MSDPVERDLNAELDKALDARTKALKATSIGFKTYGSQSMQNISQMIDRCCNEIKSVLPLLGAPLTPGVSPTAAMPTVLPQDERVLSAVKDLLVYEAQVLYDLVDALVDKDDGSASI
jgi:hypothetical protein